MGLIDSIFIKLFTKEVDELELNKGEVSIKFPKKFRVFKKSGITHIFDPKDIHFLLQLSLHHIKPATHFKVNAELEIEQKINKNAEIQSIGKFKTIHSSFKDSDTNELIYQWKIGHLGKRVLVLLVIKELEDRIEIDKRVQLTNTFLSRLKINS